MKENEFRDKLREQTRAVSVSPALRARTIRAAQGKEGKAVKKKMPMALVFALVGILMCSVALAVAGRAGVLDFVGRYQGAQIPEDAQTYVTQSEERFDAGEASNTLRELYYDGRSLRLTADFTPNDPKTLLLGVDSFPEDPWQDLTHITEEGMDDADARTIADAFREGGFERACSVNLGCDWEQEGALMGASQDFVLGEDGVLTVYSQFEFEDDLPERDFQLLVVLSLFKTDENGGLLDEREGTPLKCLYPLHLTAAARGDEGVYVSAAPAEYPSIGVRVERVCVTVKPMELYYTVEGVVTNEALYEKTDGGLLFEFIDPEKPSAEPWEQRLADGLTGSGQGSAPDEDGRFTQRGTLALSELRDVYTLRAYECWEKERFETCEIQMRPATAEEAGQIAQNGDR